MKHLIGGVARGRVAGSRVAGGLLAGALLAALLLGCSAPGSRDADRYFILEAQAGAAAAARAAPALTVMPTTASSFYDTQDIVYSRSPGTRGYYQFNHWTDRPQRAVHAQLVARFGGAGAAAGGLVLATHLEEIFHDAAQQPGTARLVIAAQLFDPKTKAVVAQRVFSGTAPAASYDAPGAVDGMRKALGTLLDDMAAWVGTQAPAAARPAS